MEFVFPTEFVKEGRVSVLVPRLRAFVKEAWEYAPSKAPVFYNPAMELNRDLAVLALQTYQRMVGREVSVCEPLTGCGVRGIRIAVEVEEVRKVVINDISSEAVRLAQFNVQHNDLSERISVAKEDANLLLNRYAAPRKRFDYIDVDPFGSPIPYVDSAVRAVRDGGLLALTATDMAPLCGVHPKACVRRYGGKPLRTEYCHELAVRLMLGGLATTAAKHDIGINPVFSYSLYNHARAYALVHYGAKRADRSVQNMGCMLHCFACFHREASKGIVSPLKRECPECGSRLHTAGPLWLGKLWDREFSVNMKKELKGKLLKHRKEIFKLVSLAVDEVEAPATYYVIDKVCDKFNLPIPSISRIVAELKKAGFQAALTSFSSKAVRTDAPARFIRETVKELSFTLKKP